MCVPPAESASFPQRDSTTRACGADACRTPPPAVDTRGVGAGRGRRGITTTFPETQSTLHSHHTTYAFALYVPTTFFFCELGPRPSGLGYDM